MTKGGHGLAARGGLGNGPGGRGFYVLGGCRVDGDFGLGAQGAELRSGGCGCGGRASLRFVPARPEIVVAGGGVREEVPDDDEDGSGHGAPRPVPADAL